jgi:membrane-associated protease RseP (regulator of RpoE activity)
VGFVGTIVVFFVGILLIVMIHEFGHYLPARRFGFRILEYFVGFGPRLWSFRRGEIEYGVKAIPAGGYVKIAGMNPLIDDVPPGDEDRAYYAKPVWQRAVVIACGPLSHFLVAAILFSIVYFVAGIPDPAAPWRLSTVAEELNGRPSPAVVAGLRAGDEVVAIDGVERPDSDQITSLFRDRVDTEVPITVERDGETLDLVVVPEPVDVGGERFGRIGIQIEPTAEVKPSVVSALAYGGETVAVLTQESIGQIGNIFGPSGIARTFDLLFSDVERERTDAVSVVGIGQQVGAMGAQGEWEQLVESFAIVVLFIGIINLIPLPPLDGGHLAVLFIEKIMGKPVDMRKLIPVSVSVLAFLVLFTLANVTLDITKPVPGP